MTNTNRIEEAKHILTMIEAVSHDDSVQLDKIDARVWCVRYGFKFLKPENGGAFKYAKDEHGYITLAKATRMRNKYTRSRDALKVIRLDGYKVELKQTYGISPHNIWMFVLYNSDTQFLSQALPTEELAELHAILQSYIWEWENE